MLIMYFEGAKLSDNNMATEKKKDDDSTVRVVRNTKRIISQHICAFNLEIVTRNLRGTGLSS